MNPRLTRTALIAALAVMSGCASISNGQIQTMTVETRADDGVTVVTGAMCKLTNANGTWFVASPGSAIVRRSHDDMQVVCEKDAYPRGIAKVPNLPEGSTASWLNINPVGVVVDYASGAAFEYPQLVTVSMGKTVTVTRPAPPQPLSTHPLHNNAASQSLVPPEFWTRKP